MPDVTYICILIGFMGPERGDNKNISSILLFQESQAHFDGFTEWLQTFELYRGKQAEEVFEEESRVVGKFKESFFFIYETIQLSAIVYICVPRYLFFKVSTLYPGGIRSHDP
jgi:hypothetical protein